MTGLMHQWTGFALLMPIDTKARISRISDSLNDNLNEIEMSFARIREDLRLLRSALRGLQLTVYDFERD